MIRPLLSAFVIISMFLLHSCASGPCSSKTYFLSSMESFVDHVGEIKEDIDDAEWELKDEEFEVFTDECYPKYRDDMTQEESDEYRSLKMQYRSYQASDNLNGLVKQGVKALSGLFGKDGAGLENELSDVIDQFKDGGEVNDAIKKLKEEFDTDGELRHTLEDLKIQLEDEDQFEEIVEKFKAEFNEGELKTIIDNLKTELKEAGVDMKEVLNDK